MYLGEESLNLNLQSVLWANTQSLQSQVGGWMQWLCLSGQVPRGRGGARYSVFLRRLWQASLESCSLVLKTVNQCDPLVDLSPLPWSVATDCLTQVPLFLSQVGWRDHARESGIESDLDSCRILRYIFCSNSFILQKMWSRVPRRRGGLVGCALDLCSGPQGTRLPVQCSF